jgi:hypothetical protein
VLYNIEEYEKESFAPVIEESNNLNQKITTLYKASAKIDTEIADVANKGNYDLLLVGVGQSIYEGSLLGKILGFTARIINPDRLLEQVTGRESLFEDAPFDEHTRLILSKSNIPVGIFIDKGLQQTGRVFVPALSDKDEWLIPYLEKLRNNSGSVITVADIKDTFKKASPTFVAGANAAKMHKDPIQFVTEEMIEKDFLQQYDLMVISEESWRKLVESKSLWLADIPSTLILARK